MNYEDLLRDLQIRLSGRSERYKRLELHERFLKGTQYDDLSFGFYDTYEDIGEYIPLRERKPSIQYNLPKIVVDRSTDMLFGDQHFPAPHVEDPDDKLSEEFLKIVMKESMLPAEWKLASKEGAVGSVFIVFKIIGGKFYHEVIQSKNCEPFWGRIPGELEKVRERKIVPGDELLPFGYNVDPNKDYWYQREFTREAEIEYFPVEYGKEDGGFLPKFVPNPDRSFEHKFGFVPGQWVKNLDTTDVYDGPATFEGILGIVKEIDYQLSQTGRAYHYAGDPTLALFDPSMDEEGEALVKTVANVLCLNKEGKAQYLEISAEAQQKAQEFVELLRKFALEVVRGSRIDPDKLSAAQSGRALALLHKDIISLVSDLRTQYGERGLVPYFKKMLAAAKKVQIKYKKLDKLLEKQKKSIKDLNDEAAITLRWGQYFEPTAEDDRATFDALGTGKEKGLISQDRAVRAIADRFDIEDVDAEITQIQKEKRAELEVIKELEVAQQASQKIKSNQM